MPRRKLDLLKQEPRPAGAPRPGAAEELAEIEARLDSDYSTGKFAYQGKTLTLDDAEDMLRTSRDPAEIERAVGRLAPASSPPMKADYARLVELANEGARELGYADTGALWRSNYDMPPDAFAAKIPTGCGTRSSRSTATCTATCAARLNEKIRRRGAAATGPIRADLLGNMWAQEWGNIYDIVAPAGSGASATTSTAALRSARLRPGEDGQDRRGLLHLARLRALPQTFWERSQITRPRDREVVCHASAWDIDDKDDIRIKMCTTVNADDFYTVHHELGHNYLPARLYRTSPSCSATAPMTASTRRSAISPALNALTPDLSAADRACSTRCPAPKPTSRFC